MNTYLILLRGINVGGKNIVPMSGLKKCLDEQGFFNVSTYIASGNVILQSAKPAGEIRMQIEQALPEYFKLDDGFIKVLVLKPDQIKSILDNKPTDFGEHPDMYHSDAIFLIDVKASEAMSAFNPREGVDKIWPGDGVIYSQRLSSQRTKSRLNQVMGSPLYKSMTIRNWNTTTKLMQMVGNLDSE
jgi:uncharacterized protein (DUF1697 family)